MRDTEYYSADFHKARARFRALASAQRGAQQRAFSVPNAAGDDLSVDYLLLPPDKEPRRLLVMVSGVHGIEGFTGSAIQAMFLTEVAGKADRSATGFLLVHSLNPYGFVHRRRATEGNVNLNRNFSLGDALFKAPNEGYKSLRGLLEPGRPADDPVVELAITAARIGALLGRKKFSAAELSQTIAQGQYEFPDGLEYGGMGPEPQVRDFLTFLKVTAENYSEVVVMDLHTGLGEPLELHMIPGTLGDPKDRELFDRLFVADADRSIYRLTQMDAKGFYRPSGDLNSSYGELRRPGQRFFGATLEYGTLGNKSWHKIHSLSRLIAENQGFAHGYSRPSAEKRTREAFEELFLPRDPVWRANAVMRARETFARVLSRWT